MEGLLADAADHVQVHRLALLRPCIAPHRQRYGQHAPLQPAPLQHAAPLPFGSIINPSSLASRGAAIPSHRSWAVRKRANQGSHPQESGWFAPAKPPHPLQPSHSCARAGSSSNQCRRSMLLQPYTAACAGQSSGRPPMPISASASAPAFHGR
ncbi:hypothetical protein G6F63_015402 [Rhizopus arrhizus]|nr:hypothetical protein G6F63_015402 [Rhizopus arrhizus]